MSLTAGVLREDALRVTESGYELDVHLPWYRSLPLSCVEAAEVTVNDQLAPRDKVVLAVDGGRWTLDELAEQYERSWFVQDPATLAVETQNPPARGTTVPVAVRLDLRIPYILIGPDRALTNSTTVEKQLVVG